MIKKDLRFIEDNYLYMTDEQIDTALEEYMDDLNTLPKIPRMRSKPTIG